MEHRYFGAPVRRAARCFGFLLSLQVICAGIAFSATPTPPAPSPGPSASPGAAKGAVASDTCSVKTPSALLITWQPGGHDATVCEPDDQAQRALATPASDFGANVLEPGPAELHRADTGIAVTFRAEKTTDFQPKRTRSGFEALHGEDRFVVEIRALDQNGKANGATLRMWANRNGACRIDGPHTEDLHDACSVAKAPDKNDAGTGRAPKGPTGCQAKDDVKKIAADTADDKKVFCGAVVANFAAVQAALNVPTIIQPRTQAIEVCTAFEADAMAESLQCGRRQLTYAGDLKPHATWQSSSGSNTGGSDSASSESAGTTSGVKRRTMAAGSSQGVQSSTQGGTTQKGLVYDFHESFPVGTAARGSLAFDKLDISSLFERLQANLAAAQAGNLVGSALSQGVTQLLPADTCGTKKCPDDSFKKLDVSVFDLVTAPFRAGVGTKFADAEIDLKPIDFSSVTNVNYGAKFVVTPHDARFGAAWYRDIQNVATASAVHGDWDLGPFSFGVTHVVANIDPANDTNVYRSAVDKAHTTNTVLGAAFRFGGGRSFQLFQRYGELARTGQRDRLTVLTWSPTDLVKPFDDAGTTWHPFAGIGYRAIDAGYDPLGTKYDQFVGTHSAFTTIGYGRFPAKDGSEADLQATITGVRAWDAVQPRYHAVSASLKAKLWGTEKAPALVLSHTRSDIAASVYARGAASVLLTDQEGRDMLRNDNDSAKLAYENGGWSYSAGPSWTNSPKQCIKDVQPGQKHCEANKNRQLAYDVHTTDVKNPLVLKFSMDLAPQQQVAFGQKAVAASQLDAKAVLRWSRWCSPGIRVQPSFTYDSNVSQTESAYTPGHLVETGIDIGHQAIGPAVLRIGYKLVHPQNLADAALAQHALFVGIAMDNTSEAFYDRCPRPSPNAAR